MVDVANETEIEFPGELLKKCVAGAVREEGKDAGFSCTVVLVSPAKIAELNEKHYSKKGPTDVLSFASDEEGYAGEIIICPSYIREHASEDRFKWEMCHAAVHGSMHLLGIHHEHNSEVHVQIHKKETEIINNILNG